MRDSCIILEESILLLRLLSGSFGRERRGCGREVVKGVLCSRSCRFAHAKLIPTSFQCTFLNFLYTSTKSSISQTPLKLGLKMQLGSASQVCLHVWVRYEGRHSVRPLCGWLRRQQSWCNSGTGSFLIWQVSWLWQRPQKHQANAARWCQELSLDTQPGVQLFNFPDETVNLMIPSNAHLSASASQSRFCSLQLTCDWYSIQIHDKELQQVSSKTWPAAWFCKYSCIGRQPRALIYVLSVANFMLQRQS